MELRASKEEKEERSRDDEEDRDSNISKVTLELGQCGSPEQKRRRIYNCEIKNPSPAKSHLPDFGDSSPEKSE